MKTLGKRILSVLFFGALLAVLSGCMKQEGPVEKAGKEVDKATEKVGEKIEKAGENIKDAAQGNKK